MKPAPGNPRIVANTRGKKRRPGTKTLALALRCSDTAFCSFLSGCLAWDKRDRLSPEAALQHPWITEATNGGAAGPRTVSGGVGGAQSARAPPPAAEPPLQQRKNTAGSARQAPSTFRDRKLFPPIDTMGGTGAMMGLGGLGGGAPLSGAPPKPTAGQGLRSVVHASPR